MLLTHRKLLQSKAIAIGGLDQLLDFLGGHIRVAELGIGRTNWN